MVLVEQTAEPIPPVHTVPIPADDGRIGRWIGRLQTKRSVGRGVPEVGRLSCCTFVFVDEAAEDVTAVELPRCG